MTGLIGIVFIAAGVALAGGALHFTSSGLRLVTGTSFEQRYERATLVLALLLGTALGLGGMVYLDRQFDLGLIGAPNDGCGGSCD